MIWDLENLLKIIENNISTIDLSQYNFVEPAFLVWVLSLYANKKITFINIDKITNIKIKNYLERSGFFSYIDHCVSISKIDRNSLFEVTTIDETTLSKVKEMDMLTTKFLQNLWLSKEDFDDLYKTFYRIMWELIDNVLTHSNSIFSQKWCLYMMQSFPRTNIIHFCVVDNGIWLKESFKDSKYYNPALWYDYYIDLAFQKWVTRDREIWAGNGLYGTLEIIKATWSQLNFVTWDVLCSQNWLDTTYSKIGWFWTWNLLDIRFHINNLNKEVIDNLISKWTLAKGLDVDELDHLNDLFDDDENN